MDKKFAILADIHANIDALQAVVEDARSQSVTNFICVGDIVGYFHQLDALDVSGIEPMAHTTPVDNVLRADEPAPGLDRADVLANAPAKRNNLILVPKILE